LGALIAETSTLRAEIRHAIEHEMAVKLEDVVMRRTELGAGSHPGRRALEATAAEMAQHLQWSDSRVREELTAMERTLARHLARAPSEPVLAPQTVRARHGAMLANSRG